MNRHQVEAAIVHEERKAKCRQFASAFGHPDWENACRSCGCQLSLDRDLCDPCQLKRDFPKVFSNK
jgi:hypothetical protein